MYLLERITRSPTVLGGKPTIRGMRISVEQILDKLGDGLSVAEIIEDFPVLVPEDIHAAVKYAAFVLRDELELLPPVAA
jgi:uncharacterized protein (DUF433 family)